MPEEGIQLSPSKDILTSAEIYYLCSLFVDQGVKKIRLTGGEPTVRKDIVPLMQKIGSLRSNGLKELALTTNGISLHRKLEQMVEAGLTGVNISLDTLDPFQFQLLTRRQGFDAVMKSIKRVQELNKLGAGVKLKINCVVMRGLNDHQILPFVDMTQDEDMEVRFIEYMPFDGNKWSQKKMVPYNEMLDIIRTKYPGLTRLRDARNDTSKTWQIPGFKGRVGFITSMTHNFCGTCNRLRITSDGNLKVCLHGNAEVSLRDLLREHHQGEPMNEAAFEAIRKVELERRKRGNGSLDGEGTWMSKEQQLLEVIGAAVKRKKAKHAGMGELENMKNRPMILIGGKASPEKQESGAWGLGNEEPWTMDLKEDSETTLTQKEGVEIGVISSPKSQESSQTGAFSKDEAPSERLTHVTPAGEAHMVNVGSKPTVKRVAIAYGIVQFTVPEPLKLIVENANKKGDVLGVARIAGIMAAKRASDIIPLCHPILISKVELEVKPLPPGTRFWGSSRPPNKFGCVTLQATVETVGPTGVEMEALMAVTGAALTVYDMCKAVDRKMTIHRTELVYKSGGRSG
ncbi:hypothetical protein M433DRAFT_86196, partial [Acidomyces richmondensis BFW]